MLALVRKLARINLTESSLASVQNSLIHVIVRMERHPPGIFPNNNVLEPSTVGENIVCLVYTLPHGQNIQIVGEEVEIDVGLY